MTMNAPVGAVGHTTVMNMTTMTIRRAARAGAARMSKIAGTALAPRLRATHVGESQTQAIRRVAQVAHLARVYAQRFPRVIAHRIV